MKQPTKTFVLDINRQCNIHCKFCYYHHHGDLTKQGFKPKHHIFQEIEEGIARGNNRTELTGGEPTMHPNIDEIIYCLKSRDIKACIITNGIVSEAKLNGIIDAGIDEFLVSVHGMEETHDQITQCKGARKTQMKSLTTISNANLPDRFRFNCVLNAYNQNEIIGMAEFMASWKPTTVNFINMNPHHGWEKDDATKNVIANLKEVEPILDHVIDILEAEGIGVNVRYYPMCRISEEHRRCICNDLHVMFDPKEWDYATFPKTYERYQQWGIDTSNNVEEKGEPCSQCDLQWVCGGANKHWHKAALKVFGEILEPQKVEDEGFDKRDTFYYRRNNTVGV